MLRTNLESQLLGETLCAGGHDGNFNTTISTIFFLTVSITKAVCI